MELNKSHSSSLLKRNLRKFYRNKLAMLGLIVIFIIVFMCVAAPLFTEFDPAKPDFKAMTLAPGGEHLLGTDKLGRDLFSRVLYGSQVSLTIPFASAIISFFLGILIGSLSGYFGGMFDIIVQRIIEVIGAVPQIPLWMALSVAIPAGISTIKMYFYMTLILSFINWTGMARVVRGKMLSLKNEDYVMAARLAGVSTWSIIWKHLVPGFMSYLIVSMTLSIPGSIVGETSMSYLGLGIKSPATSWGVLLQEASAVTEIASNPHKLIPIIFVTVTVLAFNFLGDGLRDAADPYK